jgi:hypothetical protein
MAYSVMPRKYMASSKLIGRGNVECIKKERKVDVGYIPYCKANCCSTAVRDIMLFTVEKN